jgi:glycosyltransferase involved in cell wall biosynthesis
MKIVFLSTRLDKPSSRFRILQYLPLLEQSGFKTEAMELPRRFIRRVPFYRRLSSSDVVVLHRKTLSGPDRFLLRRACRKLIFDFDDALMFRDSNSDRIFSFFRKKRFLRTLDICDRVIAGNRFLAAQCPGGRHRVRIIPTPVDTARFVPRRDARPSREKRIVLGWIGSASTLVYLQSLSPVFERLHSRYPHVVLKIVADAFIDRPGMPVIRKRWAMEEEPSDLQSFDIGLMPLFDDAWSRGKCGFKMLQYMACGVPPVCSPVGINTEIVRDGENGLIARTPEEWLEKIGRLVESPTLRSDLGRRGRETVEQRYSVAVHAKNLSTLIRKTAGFPPERGDAG